jgi:hypothetical protein
VDLHVRLTTDGGRYRLDHLRLRGPGGHAVPHPEPERDAQRVTERDGDRVTERDGDRVTERDGHRVTNGEPERELKR